MPPSVTGPLTSIVALIAVVAAAMWWSAGVGRRLPKAFRGRECQGRVWREAFPDARKQELRDFLSLFVSAFAFGKGEKLRFAPGDRILGVYRALYPYQWLPDALELEIFAKDLEARYGVRLEAVWTETLTLGELFAHTRCASAS